MLDRALHVSIEQFLLLVGRQSVHVS